MFKKIILGLALLGLTAQGQTSKIPLNNLQIGKSATGDKKIIFNRGGTNPQIKWDETAGALKQSADGSTFRDLGDVVASSAPIVEMAVNGGFESGLTGWTASGGTLELNNPNILDVALMGNWSGEWDASSAGQTLTSAAFTVPEGLAFKPLVLECKISTGFVTPVTTTMGFWDGTTLSGATTIYASSIGHVSRAWLPSGVGIGTLAIRFTSVAANEPKLKIDGCTMRESPNESTLAKTSNYTAVASDSTITGATSGGAFTITLPSAVGLEGKRFTIRKSDTSSNLLTVATTSSQTIGSNSATSTKLHAKGEAITLESDGANWIYITPEYRTESAIITGNAVTPTITQSGAWLSFTSRTGAGDYTFTISPTYPVQQTCSCSVLTSGGTNAHNCTIQVLTTSSIRLSLSDAGNSNTDADKATVMCHGPR